jgi:hypothetical protein
VATLVVATRAELGLRSLCESLERVFHRLGSGPESIHFDAELHWKARERLNMDDHPDWLTFEVRLCAIRRPLRADGT